MDRYKNNNLIFARQNRRARNATKQEAILWSFVLRKHKTNFTRQYRLGDYILDFFAPSVRLAIEVDGGQHYDDEALSYDRDRTLFLNENGVTVLRFTNEDVEKNLSAVARRINETIAALLS